jgi:hypothetical protein
MVPAWRGQLASASQAFGVGETQAPVPAQT